MQKPIWAILLLILLSTSFLKAQSNPGDHEKWEYVLEDTGDILQIALPLTALGYSLFEEDYQGTKKLAFSYATTLAITYSLKQLTQKKRPEGRQEYDSFPSGHTSSAFAGAAFIQRRYGWKHGKYAYLLATIVGVSRMEAPDGYHDTWDVLAGAAIGIGSVYLFTKPLEKSNIDIGFSSSENSKLVSFKLTF